MEKVSPLTEMSMSNTVERASQSELARQSVRRFEIVDSCEIGCLSNQHEPIELWCPIIPDTLWCARLGTATTSTPFSFHSAVLSESQRG